MKTWFFLLMFQGWVSIMYGQTVQQKSVKKIAFSKLTFHSSTCNGSCPEISMNVYKNRRIEISRTIFRAKGQVDTVLSGNFRGHLNNAAYKRVTGLVEKINWDKLNFPKVFCCDGAVRTIIISYNGKHKRFQSMTPPVSTQDLIIYLLKLSSSGTIPRYDRPIDFEKFDDQSQ